MPTSVRRVAWAAVLLALAALLIDALLQAALAVINPQLSLDALPGQSLRHVIWPLTALLLWWTAPFWLLPVSAFFPSTSSRAPLSRPQAIALVGVAGVVVPLAWLLSRWSLAALRFTLDGSWSTSGRIFLEPYFYSEALTTNAPWVLAGVVLVTLARHAE